MHVSVPFSTPDAMVHGWGADASAASAECSGDHKFTGAPSPAGAADIDADATFGALLRMQPALRAAREAHEAVVSLAVDLIALSRSGHRAAHFEQATAAFDAAVIALGLATLEHLPLGWASVAPEVAARTLSFGAAASPGIRSEPASADSVPPAPQAGVAGHGTKGTALVTTGDLPLASTAALVEAVDAEVEALAPGSTAEAVGRRAPGPAAPALPSGALDLRGRYVDPDEDSMVEWPTEDPGPVGTPPRSAAVTPSREVAALTPAVMEALRDRLSAGASPIAPSAGETSKRTAIGALQALPPVPTLVDTEAAFTEEFRRLQSCADTTRLASLAPLSVLAQAQVVRYLAARVRRLLREVPVERRPVFVAGDNAFHSLIKQLDQHLNGLRARQPALEPLALAPRQRDWLREAEVLEGQVRAAVAAAVGGAAPPAKPADPDVLDNPEKALDALLRGLDEQVPTMTFIKQVRAALTAGLAPDDPRLCSALVPRVAELVSPGFKTLRSKVRAFAKAQPKADAACDPWPVAARLAGKRLLLVGGDRTAILLARLKAHLPGVELDWVETGPGGGVRQVQAARSRVAQGSVDLLLLVQSFISHKVTDVLASGAKAASVAILKVNRGYGLAQVQSALTAHCAV